MKIYLVGGAVRDKLLGLPVKERDWVVVEGTVPEMLERGFQQVGKEFPVFIHPQTGEEYALAREERKIDKGYKGFTFDTSKSVTLEDDLKRRDLTINAMAETENGEIIDPYHGLIDLNNKLLRHVSPAFSEDPVRILRIGRFLARFTYLGFQVAPETLDLMKEMVKQGEVNALVAERVWKELERALTEKNPEKFFEVLAECGALPILFEHFELNNAAKKALQSACELSNDAAVRFAALFYTYSELSTFCQRFRIPNYFRELATLTQRNYEIAQNIKTLSAEALLDLFTRLDIFRRELRFQHFLIVSSAIAKSQGKTFDADLLNICAQNVRKLNIAALVEQGLDGKQLAQTIKEKRLALIKNWLKDFQ